MILHLWFYCIFDPIDAAVMCIRNILPAPNGNIIYITYFLMLLEGINKQDAEHQIN